jgi:hypothetical protein
MPPLTFTKVIKDTIILAAHKYKYKHGAFKDQISETTTVIHDLNHLIASPVTTKAEKIVFPNTRLTLIKIGKPCHNGKIDLVTSFAVTTSPTGLFEEDIKNPRPVNSVDDGSVFRWEQHQFNHDREPRSSKSFLKESLPRQLGTRRGAIRRRGRRVQTSLLDRPPINADNRDAVGEGEEMTGGDDRRSGRNGCQR